MSDDWTGIERALAASVILVPPRCSVPGCNELGLFKNAGALLCHVHLDDALLGASPRWFNRPPTPTELEAGATQGLSTSEIMRL